MYTGVHIANMFQYHMVHMYFMCKYTVPLHVFLFINAYTVCFLSRLPPFLTTEDQTGCGHCYRKDSNQSKL